MTGENHDAPKILDLPTGLDATGMRKELDSLGDVEVPANRYWGTQTQRSPQHFNIGTGAMTKEVYPVAYVLRGPAKAQEAIAAEGTPSTMVSQSPSSGLTSQPVWAPDAHNRLI